MSSQASVVATATKCSKPAGSPCRIHNPAGASKGFVSAADVFKELDSNKPEVKTPEREARANAKAHGFDDLTEERLVADSAPEDLREHIRVSAEALEHLTEEQKTALRGYGGFGAGVANNVLRETEGYQYQYYDQAPPWRETTGPCDFYDREELVSWIETVDSVLATRQEEQRIIYRGTPLYSSIHDELGAIVGRELRLDDTEGLAEGLKEYYKPGKVFHHKTYVSTTLSAHYAAERTTNTADTKADYYNTRGKAEVLGLMFEMKTNAGVDITGLANKHYAYEREIVVPRDTYFKVVNVEVTPSSYKTSSGTHEDLRDNEGERESKDYSNIAAVIQMVEVDKDGNELTSTAPHRPTRDVRDIVTE